MTAAQDFEDVRHLAERMTPGQIHELRAHALRLVSPDSRSPKSWREVKASASGLPPVDAARLRADLDEGVDSYWFPGDAR